MSNSPTNSQPSSSFIPEKMSTKPRVEIGAKGTVGSLIMQEMEYFNRLDIHSSKHSLQVKEGNQTRGKRKNKFIPSICSAIDVDENNGPKKIQVKSYKNSKRFSI